MRAQTLLMTEQIKLWDAEQQLRQAIKLVKKVSQ